MTSQPDAGTVVRTCLEALQAGDSEEALALLSPDVEWRNTGLPAIRGHRAHQALRDMARRGIGFEVVLHHLAVDGDVVLTDRTDVLSFRRFRMKFWVCGTFVVRDGQVVLWDDHFSPTNFVGAAARGLLGSALPR